MTLSVTSSLPSNFDVDTERFKNLQNCRIAPIQTITLITCRTHYSGFDSQAAENYHFHLGSIFVLFHLFNQGHISIEILNLQVTNDFPLVLKMFAYTLQTTEGDRGSVAESDIFIQSVS